MELKFDTSKTYAIALEGGGARGAYEVGAWKALDEAGVKYNAVAGTSVGALNGAMMAMRDLEGAIDAWWNIRLSNIVEVDSENEDEMLRLFAGEADLSDIQEILPHAVGIIKNRGLDVSPLRRWVTGLADTAAIKNSDVALYVTTVALSDKKGLTVKVNDLPEEEMCDMLLASAYHPSFRLEKLGGKYYTDGGFFDSLPISPLVDAGYRDIIAICLPGAGVHKPFLPPRNVNISYIEPTEDLGGVLNFDAANARRIMDIGYMDAKRLLYGLAGRCYYVERTIEEREALELLLDIYYKPGMELRQLTEKELPRIADKLEVKSGSYHDILIAHYEQGARERELPRIKVYGDREFIELARA